MACSTCFLIQSTTTSQDYLQVGWALPYSSFPGRLLRVLAWIRGLRDVAKITAQNRLHVRDLLGVGSGWKRKRPAQDKGARLVATVETCHIWWLVMMWRLALRVWEQAGSGTWVVVCYRHPFLLFTMYSEKIGRGDPWGLTGSSYSLDCLLLPEVQQHLWGPKKAGKLGRFKYSRLSPHCPGSAGPSAAEECRLIFKLNHHGAGALKLCGTQILRKHLELAFPWSTSV